MREPTTLQKIEAWLQAAKIETERKSEEKFAHDEVLKRTLTWSKGPKYYKVYHIRKNEIYGDTFMFIDFEGNIYKPSGSMKPAKGIRYTISSLNPTEVGLNCGFLYKRNITTKLT